MNPELFLNTINKKERKIFVAAGIVFLVSSIISVYFVIKENNEMMPVKGGSYREGLIGQPIIINPIISTNQIDQDISALIYSPLGDIISNYEIQKDERNQIIKIKENQKWSNGQPLTSDDIIFTISTIQNPDAMSPLRKIWEGITVERLSELQIKFILPTKYVFFKNAIEQLPIIPRHIFGAIPPNNLKLSSYNLMPVGNGPYKFESFSKRKDGFISQYHLITNENYQSEKPFISDFYFKFFEGEEDLSRAFKFRQIDGFGTLNPLTSKIAEMPSSNISIIPMSRYYAIFFNQNSNSFIKNKDFREALRDSIDTQKILNEIFSERFAKKIYSPIIESEMKNDKIENEEIKKIIDGYKKTGKSITLNLIVPKINFLEKTAEIIKKNWEAVGINEINIITVETGDILDGVIKTNNYEMILFGNVLSNQEDLFPFWHSRERLYPGLNLSLYKNQKADIIMEKIRETNDPNERKVLLKEVEKKITEDTPAIFLYSLPYLYIHSSNTNKPNANPLPISSAKERFKTVIKWYTNQAMITK